MWDDGWVLVILLWVFLWWALIPYFIFKWSYKYIYVPYDDAKETKRLSEAAERAQIRQANQLELLAQKLREAAPKTPVEKMRATILVEGSEVDMLVELSEQERAVIRQHDLSYIELENVPLYSADEIARMRADHQREADEISAVRQPYLKAVVQQSVHNVAELQKRERSITTLGDLLVVPYRRTFSSTYEAKQHADRLKSEHLPKVRQIIDQFMAHKPVETVEF